MEADPFFITIPSSRVGSHRTFHLISLWGDRALGNGSSCSGSKVCLSVVLNGCHSIYKQISWLLFRRECPALQENCYNFISPACLFSLSGLCHVRVWCRTHFSPFWMRKYQTHSVTLDGVYCFLLIQAQGPFIKRDEFAARGFAVEKSILTFLIALFSCTAHKDFVLFKIFLAFEGKLTDRQIPD